MTLIIPNNMLIFIASFILKSKLTRLDDNLPIKFQNLQYTNLAEMVLGNWEFDKESIDVFNITEFLQMQFKKEIYAAIEELLFRYFKG